MALNVELVNLIEESQKMISAGLYLKTLDRGQYVQQIG